MGDQIVGREAELAAVERFLAAPSDEPAALVVEGEAGIGKTTVWLEAVRLAEARGLRVLRGAAGRRARRGSPTPRSPISSAHVFDETAAIRCRPCRSGRSRRRCCGASRTRRAPARTTATALRQHARRRSRSAARCSSRSTTCSGSTRPPRKRSRSRPGGCRRGSACSWPGGRPGEELPLGLARALPEDRVERVAAGAALARRAAPPRRRSARSVAAAPAARASWPTPLAETRSSRSRSARALERRRRPRRGRAAARAAAASRSSWRHVSAAFRSARSRSRSRPRRSRSPTRRLLAERSAGSSTCGAALVEAEEAGVLRHRARPDPLHPPAARLRRLRLRVARSGGGSCTSAWPTSSSDPEQRARHLALSTTEPDEEIAAELEQAAQQAARERRAAGRRRALRGGGAG